MMILSGKAGIESIHALGSDISDVYHGNKHVWPELEQGALIEKVFPGTNDVWRWAKDVPAITTTAPRFEVLSDGQVTHRVGLHTRPIFKAATSGGHLDMVSGYLESSRDMTFTGTLGDESLSNIDIWETQEFSCGIDGVAEIKVTGSRARIVEASGSATPEFDIPTFATTSRWGELRLRVTERKIKLYKDNGKIYEKPLTVTVPDRVRLRIKVPDGYLRTTGILVKKYYSGGGPCFDNLCLYTGLESAKRAEIWRLDN